VLFKKISSHKINGLTFLLSIFGSQYLWVMVKHKIILWVCRHFAAPANDARAMLAIAKQQALLQDFCVEMSPLQPVISLHLFLDRRE
jgi:hypothetical protein